MIITTTTFAAHVNKMKLPKKGTKVSLTGRVKLARRVYGPAFAATGVIGAKGSLVIEACELRDVKGGAKAATEKRLESAIGRIWLSATNAEAHDGFGRGAHLGLPFKGSVEAGSLKLVYTGKIPVPAEMAAEPKAPKAPAPKAPKAPKAKTPKVAATNKAAAKGRAAAAAGFDQHAERLGATAQMLQSKFGWNAEKALIFAAEHLS